MSYVSVVDRQGTGKPLRLRGKAFLLITVRGPASRRFPVDATELVKVNGFAVFRQVRGAGTAHSVTAIGVGLRVRMPFRVSLTEGPGHGSRLVVDVAR